MTGTKLIAAVLLASASSAAFADNAPSVVAAKPDAEAEDGVELAQVDPILVTGQRGTYGVRKTAHRDQDRHAPARYSAGADGHLRAPGRGSVAALGVRTALFRARRDPRHRRGQPRPVHASRQQHHRRPVHRRHPRRRAIFPRLLQRRAGRGAEGPQRDDLRPRRRRRNRQPGDQARVARHLSRGPSVQRQLRRFPRRGRCRPGARGWRRRPPQRALRRWRQLPPPRRSRALRDQPDGRVPAGLIDPHRPRLRIFPRPPDDRPRHPLDQRPAARGLRPHLLRRSRQQLCQGQCEHRPDGLRA